jgi:8-oxo-dGTP pyrophosphatase MutT (NUDIX family)
VLADGAGHVLFVRHTYGDRRAWELPGGGIKAGEQPSHAVAREAREEVGADVAPQAWTLLTNAEARVGRRRDGMRVFGAAWPGGAVVPDDLEIGDFAWFRLDALPERVGRSTRAALGALAGAGPPGPSAAPRA